MTTFYFELNTLKPQEQIYQLPTRVGDNNTTMEVTIMNGDDPYDFTGKYLEFAMVRPDREWVHLKECVTQVHDNVWSCTLPPEALAVAGIANLAYFVVRDEEDGRFRDSTQRIQILIDDSATGNVKIGPYSDQVDALIREATMLLDAWENQLKSQKYEFDHAMDVWADRFSKAVKSWDADFKKAQEERTTAYQQAEHNRDEQFAAAEATRNEKSDAAAERANAAAEKIEKALVGDLDDLFKDWIDNQKDTEGGLVSYDAMKRGDYVSVDDVTIQKSEKGQLSVKDQGIGTLQIADKSVTEDKIADGAITEEKIAADALGVFKGATLEEAGTKGLVPAPSADDYSSYLWGNAKWYRSDFENLSWGQLVELSEDAIKSPYRFRDWIGKSKQIAFAGYAAKDAVLIDVGKDGVGFIFIVKGLLRKAIQASGSWTGWKESEIRTFLNGELLSAFPQELQSCIKEMTKAYNPVSSLNTVQTCKDKLWLPSTTELGDTDTPVLGTMYEYFLTDAQNRRKGIYSETYWWTRKANSSSYAWGVNTGGAFYSDYYYVNFSYGVCPCFGI